MEKNLNTHIENNERELDNPEISSQRRRHLEGELEDLKVYQKNHPDDDHDPTPLELYCDSHPNALECRVYEE